MPSTAVAYVSEIFVNSGLLALSRELGGDGTPVNRAALSSISCVVYDRDNYNAVVATPSVSVASSVFDTLQTGDSRWKADAVGYNFLFELPAACFPLARSYRVVFTFTPASGDPFDLVLHVIVRDPKDL